MGRRKNNPELVQELIEQLMEENWTKGEEDEFNEKYRSLSKSDKQAVDEAYDDMEDDDGGKPECCVACGCPAYPDCMDSCSIFDD